jgi:hypothetical protein
LNNFEGQVVEGQSIVCFKGGSRDLDNPELESQGNLRKPPAHTLSLWKLEEFTAIILENNVRENIG